MFLWSWMRGASVQQEYLTLVWRHSAPRAETDPCMHATSVVPICGFVHRKPSCRGALVRAPDALNEVSWATLCLLCCLTTPTVTSLSVRWKRLELAEPLPKGLIIVNGIVCPDYSRNGGGRSEGGREREREGCSSKRETEDPFRRNPAHEVSTPGFLPAAASSGRLCRMIASSKFYIRWNDFALPM